MANSRYYSSIALPTTLTGAVTSSGTTITVAATTGFPGSLPYTLALDYGSATEELVEVTNVASLTLTIVRGIDSTANASHNPGAVVRHVSSARDFTDSRTHEASASGVHGVSGAVVGTSDSQSLSNKTLVRALGSMQNATFYNVGGSGITQIIGDSTNPNASRLEIKDNEVALNTMVFIQNAGNIKSVRNAGDADSAYKFRVTDNDGTTDRAAILAGGTVTLTPTSATTFVAADIVAPDTSTSKRAIRVAAAGGGTERLAVFNDGHVAISGTASGQTLLKVTAAGSPSVDIFNVSDNTASTLFAVQSTGRFLGNKGGTIAQPGVTSGAVFQVGGSNVGYTGNLQQWVSPANAIVAAMTEAGNLSTNAISAATTAWSTYVPNWANEGSATFSTNTGYYHKLGKIVFVDIYSTVNVAGSGGSGGTPLTVTLPSNPDRSQRQSLTLHGETIKVNGGTGASTIRGGEAVTFTGGTGAIIDRLRVDDSDGDGENNLYGADLIAGGIINIHGWYREA